MSHLRYQIRALLILRAMSRGSLYPAPLEAVHTMAYLADALASVWDLPVLDDMVLKTLWVPRSSGIQGALDRLVGASLTRVQNVDYVERGARIALQADYDLNEELVAPIFAVVDGDPDWSAEFLAISEISTAVTGMGRERFHRAALVDASYSDPLLDANTVVDLEPDMGDLPSRTQAANLELRAIALEELGRGLTPAEVTHLYARHLFALTEVVS